MAAAIDPRGDYFQRTFDGLRLGGGTIDEASFEECTFTNSSFESCSMTGCAFVSCTFTDCNLSLAKPAGSRFNDVVFRTSKLAGVDWTKAAASAVGNTIAFEDCVLDYAVFNGCKLRGWSFRRCSLVDADFSEADLEGALFPGSNLGRAQFHHTNLKGAHLEGAYGYSIDVETNRVRGAYFSLPEAASLLSHLGIHLVESPEEAQG